MAQVFLYMLVGGLAAAVAAAPIRLMSWRYLRNVGALGLALSAGVTAYHVYTRGWRAGIAADWSTGLVAANTCAMAIWVAMCSPPLRANRLRAVAASAGATALAALIVQMGADGRLSGLGATLALAAFASTLAGTWVLGSVTAAWLLGHAYLTATRMTIAPLRQLSRQLSAAVALRITLLLLLAGMLRGTAGGAHQLLPILERNWLVAALQAAVGLIALPVFAYMVSDCVKRRATQAATGILYFASVFAYISELCALYLLAEFQRAHP